MFQLWIRNYFNLRFKIYEDLKIISEMAKDEDEGLVPKFWKKFTE